MTAQPPEVDDLNAKKRAAADARKAAAQVEQQLDDARERDLRTRREIELLEAETAGDDLSIGHDGAFPNDAVRAAEVAKSGAELRAAYAAAVAIPDRGYAGWAASKITEAKTRLETVKENMKAEVRRAERELANREDFFESKLLAWALAQPPDKGTKHSIRCPEYGVRLQVQDDEVGGVKILDENALCAEVIEQLGPLAAMEYGIVEQRFALRPTAFKEFFEGSQGLDPAKRLSFRWATYEPRRPTKKLVIVRT